MLTLEIFNHDAFILTHGVSVKRDGKEVWSNLYSSETAARKAGEAKIAELEKDDG